MLSMWELCTVYWCTVFRAGWTVLLALSTNTALFQCLLTTSCVSLAIATTKRNDHLQKAFLSTPPASAQRVASVAYSFRSISAQRRCQLFAPLPIVKLLGSNLLVPQMRTDVCASYSKHGPKPQTFDSTTASREIRMMSHHDARMQTKLLTFDLHYRLIVVILN